MFRDNEIVYLKMLEGIMDSVDPECKIEYIKKINGAAIRIVPSEKMKDKIDFLMNKLIAFHNFINTKVDFSKSIKASGKIYYEIIDNDVLFSEN